MPRGAAGGLTFSEHSPNVIVLDCAMPTHYILTMSKHKAGDQAVAVAYVRVSTEEQNLGPEAQRAAIGAWAERHGVRIAATFEDRLSGGTAPEDRPGLVAAL